jgi:hypothetical protein
VETSRGRNDIPTVKGSLFAGGYFVFVLAGIRFHVMAELITIKRKIDKLLDKYSNTNDVMTKKLIESQLERKRQELIDWQEEHGCI